MSNRRVLVVLSALGLVTGLALPAAAIPEAAASASGATVTLAGSGSPAAARTPTVGSVDPASPVDFQIVLSPRSPAVAQDFASAVSTPGDPLYRHFLTAAQWEARFSPTAAQVAGVTAWLGRAGLQVTSVSADRLDVAVAGSAAQVEQAFGTRLSLHSVDGRVLRLADSDLSVPAALSGVVAGASGISQTVTTPDLTTGGPTPSTPSAGASAVPQPPGFRVPQPCGSYYGQKADTVQPPFGQGYPYPAPYAVCGYTPPQLRSAYQLPDRKAGGPDGTGVTVAVLDAYVSPTLAADSATYAAINDPGHGYAPGQFSELLAPKFNHRQLCGATGWYGEQTLDVEAVHATAPGAKILYVGAANCLGSLFTSLQNVVDHGLANVVTDSWGDNGGDLLDDRATRTSVDNILTLAASTGISVLFSSGDNGDEFPTLGLTSADYPASSPWATAVGGTTLQIGAAAQRTGETGWSTARSYLCSPAFVTAGGCSSSSLGTWLPVTSDGGSGGGTSYHYTQPAYQAGIVPVDLAIRNSALTGPTPFRVVPDISMVADPGTGFLVGETQQFPDGTYYDQYRIGGTSVSSPLLAGTVAVADQVAHGSLGFLNPALYGLHTSAPTAEFDTLPAGLQDQARVDYANSVSNAQGLFYSTRLIDYQGPETYCDATGNCATRNVDLSVRPGYDDMTGLGSPGPDFVTALAKA